MTLNKSLDSEQEFDFMPISCHCLVLFSRVAYKKGALMSRL
ncbi:hypothetical protein AB6D20_027605 (plasmid) [Vibrio splendidus]